ncbi:hypothetical protein LJC26_08445 [Desulfovibrio sp. OttesenSCG-928-O18]|nr:hypothetical protein [Desulfovibrio sp. OttesenSCG-928-O18]
MNSVPRLLQATMPPAPYYAEQRRRAAMLLGLICVVFGLVTVITAVIVAMFL